MDPIIQGTDAWRLARLGKVTASRVADVMAKGKAGAPSATRATYMGQLIAERMTGEPMETFSNATMQRGNEIEPDARAAYCFLRDADVEEVGFVDHPRVLMSGASPDGLVGLQGQVEIKCPNTATHIETLIAGAPPAKYRKQMLWQLACTRRAWCDFVSFDPRMPAHLRLFVGRVTAEASEITEMETEVAAFLRELDDKVIRLNAAHAAREAA